MKRKGSVIKNNNRDREKARGIKRLYTRLIIGNL